MVANGHVRSRTIFVYIKFSDFKTMSGSKQNNYIIKLKANPEKYELYKEKAKIRMKAVRKRYCDVTFVKKNWKRLEAERKQHAREKKMLL